tara:strand:+ start:1351 stop:2073 length:723 start_codon:yes stop_codon:yes gene_type:complete
MEQINKLIEEAIIKFDNFGEKKPTKQSSVKAYRDILCKLHTAIHPQSENKYPDEKELCKIFENHNIILKKFDNGEWLDLSVATKKNYLNVIINIIPKIKSIEPHLSKSKKWVDKKITELKVIMDNYKSIIDTIKKSKQEEETIEKKPVVEEPIEPIVEEPIVELTSIDEIDNVIKKWEERDLYRNKIFYLDIDINNLEFEKTMLEREKNMIEQKINLLDSRIGLKKLDALEYHEELKNIK